MGNEPGKPLNPDELIRTRDIASLDAELQAKLLSKGQKYNLKVVIRGEKNTGKTCLWRRLRGLPFQEGYVPTPEMQVGNILWNYKVTDDGVKVEIWDVVDKAKKKKSRTDLKSDYNDSDSDSDPEISPEKLTSMIQQASLSASGGSFTLGLDSSNVRIYQGTHVVIMMVDPTKKWSYEYAKREIPKIPQNIFTLLIMNYRDMAEHRTVSEAEVRSWVESQKNPFLRTIEASMKNAYGLRGIVAFFSLPFLKLQRSYIEQQLAMNDKDYQVASDEFALLSGQEDYSSHLKVLDETRKAKKDKKIEVPVETVRVGNQAEKLQVEKLQVEKSQVENSKVQLEKSSPRKDQLKLSNPSQPAVPAANPAASVKQPAAPVTPAKQPAAPAAQPAVKEAAPSKGFFGRMFGLGGDTSAPAFKPDDSKKVVDDLKKIALKGGSGANLDEFETGDVDDGFFGGDDDEPKAANEEDSDDEDRNPMLMADEDIGEIPSDDEPAPAPKKSAFVSQVEIQDENDEFNPGDYETFQSDDENDPVPIDPSLVMPVQVEKPETPPSPVQQQPSPVKSPPPVKLQVEQPQPKSQGNFVVPPIQVEESSEEEETPKQKSKKATKGKKSKPKKSSRYEDSDSDSDAPNSMVIQNESFDDDDDEWPDSVMQANKGGDDDPFNVDLNGGDADFDSILKPIKPYPKATFAPRETAKSAESAKSAKNAESAKTAEANANYLGAVPMEEPKKEEKPKKKKGPPSNETPEEREARKRRIAAKKAKARKQ
eukprot:TRINITY_DN251_c0_g2_i7.p1 TRINITY_DN251_c0_g2~~TRINITY_DN251_c0_g2_i7.p1  ORF type:complete len:783 (+),score=351.78 TRINITY_DN251_c0_g2_i7:58-2349(+)